MEAIKVQNLTKEFKVMKRKKGVNNVLKNLFFREYEKKIAVENISLSINQGELVGYIGMNGAGKSTTVKMLAGILYPTSGEVLVRGIMPHKNRKENAMNIGVVFGQRTQLNWDLPMYDTFELHQKMYRIDDKKFNSNVDFFVELLEMQSFYNTPIRQLSLGQKMRVELAMSMLHEPAILYLDEPTIGLDILIKQKIRKFINEINREKKTTVILTTHDMEDIDQICNRLIMIDKGKILYDGKLENFKAAYTTEKTIVATFKNPDIELDIPELTVVKENEAVKWLVFNKEKTNSSYAVSQLLSKYEIVDIEIKETRLEDVVKKFYE